MKLKKICEMGSINNRINNLENANFGGGRGSKFWYIPYAVYKSFTVPQMYSAPSYVMPKYPFHEQEEKLFLELQRRLVVVLLMQRLLLHKKEGQSISSEEY